MRKSLVMMIMATVAMISPVAATAQPAPTDISPPEAPQRDRARENQAVDALRTLEGEPLTRRLTALSDSGNLVARWQLAMLLDTGQRGVRQDPARARVLALSAAEGGEALAWTSLGVLYATGRGGPVDYAASMRAYRRAAQLGERHGFFGVGVLYMLGQGVERDQVTAAGWFMASAVQNDEQAVQVMRQIIPTLSAAERAQAVSKANEILAQHGLTQRIGTQ